jgi:hypothetical protein
MLPPSAKAFEFIFGMINLSSITMPRKYAATFFSYIDPVTMKMDSGFTEHSGCPVVEGTKRIVTQWVRLGVDKENPWNSFNTREFVFCILHP